MSADIGPVRVLVFGAGSIGAVYIHQLQQAKCHVTAVCRSNYTIVSTTGFRLNSVRFGNITYRPDAVVKDISECQGTFDYVVVCAKSYPDAIPSLADILRPVVENKPETTILLAQNGIMIEEGISMVFPENPLLSGVIYCPAIQIEPGVIDYPEMLNLLELGTYPADAPARHKVAAHSFAKLMIAGGGGAEVHEDIQVARWSKLLMNCVWNPICALTLCTDGDFLTTSETFAYELAWETMLEVVELSKRIGVVGVTEDIAREKFQISKTRAKNGTGRAMSMLQDVRQSRPMEVEAILGNVMHIGRDNGLKMPRLATIYALINARNWALLKSNRSNGT